jgi:hypothetical protein
MKNTSGEIRDPENNRVRPLWSCIEVLMN